MTRFRKIKESSIKNYDPEHYAFLYDIEFFDIESNLFNNFISYSKCREVIGAGVDNGRVCCAKHLRITCTDVDLELIKKAYSFSSMKIKEVRVAYKDYLPSYMVEFILHCYERKTALKNVSGQEEIYGKYKAMTNCIYGACCTDLVKSSVVFDSERLWVCPPLTDEIKQEKLDEMKKTKQLFCYSWGCWVTAIARKNLFERIIECNVTRNGIKYSLDSDVVYYDTDSLKMNNFEIYKPYFEKYNKSCLDKMKECAKHHKIDFDMYQPKDKNGIRHPLGVYDFNDGDYEEFCTLGSKRYVYRDSEDHKLHISISGVNKKEGVKLLKDDIRNFTKDTFFDYDYAGKMIHYYLEGHEPVTFTDVDGNTYTDNWQYGVILQPTTYSLGIDLDFEMFIDACEEYAMRTTDYFAIRDKIEDTRERRRR